MTAQREALRRFMISHANDPQIMPNIFEFLQPLFHFAASGKYFLETAGEFDRRYGPDSEEICRAIEVATGNPVTRTIFVTTDRASASLLKKHEETSLLRHLSDRYLAELEERLGKPMAEELWEQLREHLGQSLIQALPEQHRYTMWNCIGPSVYYLLGFAMLGEYQVACQLDGLVGLLPYAVPVRNNLTHPGQWFVLVP